MMNSQLGVVTAMHCYLRKAPGSSNAENGSGIEDEIFSGWAVRRLEEPDENGWVKIETHYGYEGYVNTSEFREIQKRELEQRQSKEEFFRISIGEADLLTIPKVQGLPLELLMKNAIVQLLEWEETTGWSRIRTAAGREGYVHMMTLIFFALTWGNLTESNIFSLVLPTSLGRQAWRKKDPGWRKN